MVPRRSRTMTVWLHSVYPRSANAVWDNRMARRPQMDMSFDLQPSLEYIQWYSSTGKPYLLGGQSIVVLLHMQ
ncbi:hypothetical protein J1N35_014379 [Gossypium stocksii]|uniref:Uncharacterized protein n=1 Tax=Gossypium stocksii TaxID=47602 RepID=A0A9D4A7J5_9ROSI|nr:hypothetical protein J1N35_014379 [Gossypium stocksii]